MGHREENEQLESQLQAAIATDFQRPGLNRELHVKFHMFHLSTLVKQYMGMDVNRGMLIYFPLAALDMLGATQFIPNKAAIIDWIYSLQVIPTSPGQPGGFRGGSFAGNSWNPRGEPIATHPYDVGHVSMVYTCLAALKILGDDYSRVNKQGIADLFRATQLADGSLMAIASGSESDVRFVYSACAAAALLNDWNGVDKDRATQYVLRCQTYEGAFSHTPETETHGSSTYLCVASLALMDRLHLIPRRDDLIRWCLSRQICGFQGRCNKPADTCYSFWIGGTLQLLGAASLISADHLVAFNMGCQSAKGGFAKWPDHSPDLVHSYFALAGFSIARAYDWLPELDCSVGILKRTMGQV